MVLEELLEVINDSTVAQLFSAETNEPITDGLYDGKDSIDESYNYCTVTDVFTEHNVLCVEILIE